MEPSHPRVYSSSRIRHKLQFTHFFGRARAEERVRCAFPCPAALQSDPSPSSWCRYEPSVHSDVHLYAVHERGSMLFNVWFYPLDCFEERMGRGAFGYFFVVQL